MAFSPDGTRLLSGSDDRTLKLWDAGSGELIRTFTGHTFKVAAVAFSPDGKHLLSGSSDKTAQAVGRGERAADPHLRGALRSGQLGGVLARRHAPALGQLGQDDEAVGRGERAADPDLRRALGLGQLCGVLARRHAPHLGQLRRDASNLERRTGELLASLLRLRRAANGSP